MKRFLCTIIVTFIPMSGIAAAEHSLDLSVTNDFIYRGISQTNNMSAIQAEYKISQSKDSGYYAGLFSSNVSRGIEFDLYGGIKTKLDGFYGLVFDFGAVEYLYTDLSFSPIYHEFYYGLSKAQTYGKFYYGEGDAHYLDLGTRIPVVKNLDMDFHYGHSFGSTVIGQDFSLGLRAQYNKYTLVVTYTYEDRTLEKQSNVGFSITNSF